MKQVYKVKLSDKDRNELRRITAKGKENVRKIRRAHILLLSDGGKTDREIMERVGVTRATVVRIRKRYVTEGLTKALEERPRSGRPVEISNEARAKITALACTKGPDGRSRWTLRLLATTAVELKFVEDISHETVSEILKKKRTETPFEGAVVYRKVNTYILVAHGTNLGPLCTAL
ncbi:helix-turn-helix domain-containing protein [Chloroflexi bacterium TSY]|nr:helix-turn-helix domain-containing protein [Chloroflexi bacterium TSY]MBV7339375.1 helix-turn-helix domain-containing protein [Chloroflexi bacterium TSY]